jgi:predicted double-glycine peptidase
MKKSNIIEIKGHPQENYYTCGCASFRTVLTSFDLEDVSEQDMEVMLNTTDKSGTHYDSMIAN